MQQLVADDSLLGQYVDCPSCGKRFRVQQERNGDSLTCSAQSQMISMTPAIVFMGLFSFLFFVPYLNVLLSILGVVYALKLHYKCWSAIPTNYARTTPGKAVGYMFIPFYSLYWVWPSVNGLADDCLTFAKSKGIRGFDSIRHLGLVLTILVYFPIPIIFFVVWLLFYQRVTHVLNGIKMMDMPPQQINAK